jgi:hypothetical protein
MNTPDSRAEQRITLQVLPVPVEVAHGWLTNHFLEESCFGDILNLPSACG